MRQGLVMLARGEAQAAVMAARDVVGRFDRAGNLVLSAPARATAGAALAAAGEPEAAKVELLAAESVLSAAGAAHERDAVVRTLRQLGHRVIAASRRRPAARPQRAQREGA